MPKVNKAGEEADLATDIWNQMMMSTEIAMDERLQLRIERIRAAAMVLNGASRIDVGNDGYWKSEAGLNCLDAAIELLTQEFQKASRGSD